jgi:hypothetical protein
MSRKTKMLAAELARVGRAKKLTNFATAASGSANKHTGRRADAANKHIGRKRPG